MQSLCDIITSKVDARRSELAAKQATDTAAMVEAVTALNELTSAVRAAGVPRVVAALSATSTGDIPLARAIEGRVEAWLVLHAGHPGTREGSRNVKLCKVRFCGITWTSMSEDFETLAAVIHRYCSTTPGFADEVLSLVHP